MSETVEELTPDMKGRWLISTQRSKHIWDLDNMTYQRLPGESSKNFDCDGATVKITEVGRWPRVGSVSFIWFDDPEFPDEIEHWRQSSTIKSIEKIKDE